MCLARTKGRSFADIAAEQRISELTARTHLHAAYVKLGVHNLLELVNLFSRLGLV